MDAITALVKNVAVVVVDAAVNADSEAGVATEVVVGEAVSAAAVPVVVSNAVEAVIAAVNAVADDHRVRLVTEQRSPKPTSNDNKSQSNSRLTGIRLMRTLLAAACFAAIASTANAQGRGGRGRDAIEYGWEFDYQAGIAKAISEDKPLMIVFR